MRADGVLGFPVECQRFGLDLSHPGFKAMGERAKLQERRRQYRSLTKIRSGTSSYGTS